ncbi:efflux RND transporter periplasmic adaptor subunit [Veillonella denticariosi JCM 15641]|uniref:Efflux RND transporter periplasmic adaptor subunit n=1 Tax=Veillonella denticariosi JCM 15641 TaxID=1298594 RepID=A0A2S7ZAC7_9FIRM|nr:efflux RND transporter periplasmic adaptor subunit [Veillonella denticariosi]PQL20213.1 efflux RND transporter periplasmic adaptor subunit [Veillonella denticariosi JCM 15641]
MKRNRIYSVLAILCVVCMALAIAGCGAKNVSVADVTYKDMPLQIHNDANVTALNKATVTPTLTGQVVYAVKVGDHVEQGQTLATVDTSSLQQSLAALQEQLVQAQSYAPAVTTTTTAPSVGSEQLAQAQRMREAGVITQKEYDRIVERSQPQTTVTSSGGGGGANTAAIEAQIAQVSAQIGASTIVAPMEGTVTAIYNEDRQMAIADRPFMMIQQTTPMVASLSIPRDAAMKLSGADAKNGMKVFLKVSDQEIPGELTYIDTNQPESVPSVLVKATFNNDKGLIKAGEFYTLVIESDVKAKMLTVPAAAIRENQDGKYVYVVTENNTVDVRVVEVGITEDDTVAIVSGLNEGDRVITTGGTFELGESVKI